jgi:KDO2-lipid IV(A) lauroyltransferase
MQLFVYILFYPLIWIISLFPFRLLYMFSDAIAFLFYYIIGYRKEIVLNNLRIALPEKTDKELNKIRQKFYRHFVDIFMEMIKSKLVLKNIIHIPILIY